MDIREWGAVGSIAALLGGTVIGVLRLMFLTRKEHERICEKRDERVQEQLDKITHALERQDERSAEFRKEITGRFQQLVTQDQVSKLEASIERREAHSEDFFSRLQDQVQQIVTNVPALTSKGPKRRRP